MTYQPPAPAIRNCTGCQSLYLTSEGCCCLGVIARLTRRARLFADRLGHLVPIGGAR